MPSLIHINESYEGESIEQKVERIMNNNEPITDGAPLIYTDRADGVQPDYNIRTDRFEVALDAMTSIAKGQQATREERHKPPIEKTEQKPPEGNHNTNDPA